MWVTLVGTTINQKGSELDYHQRVTKEPHSRRQNYRRESIDFCLRSHPEVRETTKEGDSTGLGERDI